MALATERPGFGEAPFSVRYLFTQANSTDNGVSQTLLPAVVSQQLHVEGFYYWFRVRTGGTLTGITYLLQFTGGSTISIFDAELDVTAAHYTSDLCAGKVAEGPKNRALSFTWTTVGGLPLPSLKGGIIVWGTALPA